MVAWKKCSQWKLHSPSKTLDILRQTTVKNVYIFFSEWPNYLSFFSHQPVAVTYNGFSQGTIHLLAVSKYGWSCATSVKWPFPVKIRLQLLLKCTWLSRESYMWHHITLLLFDRVQFLFWVKKCLWISSLWRETDRWSSQLQVFAWGIKKNIYRYRCIARQSEQAMFGNMMKSSGLS